VGRLRLPRFFSGNFLRAAPIIRVEVVMAMDQETWEDKCIELARATQGASAEVRAEVLAEGHRARNREAKLEKALRMIVQVGDARMLKSSEAVIAAKALEET
jgi:hypothetical protein